MVSRKLKILFVCGSLEPGRDGVGDYTRLLAAELIKRGYSVSIIALRDKFIQESYIGRQNQSGVSIETLRCTIADKLATRASAANKYAKSLNPDLISLQFVPYAFSTQGIPMGLGSVIRSLSKSARIHMMIHEPYLTGKLNLKNRMVRMGQIIGLKNLAKTLLPFTIHTTIPSYQKLLRDIGVQAELLGLFGNLPIAICEKKQSKKGKLNGVYFGIGPVEKNFERFSTSLEEFTNLSGREINLSFCGSLGSVGENFVEFLKSKKIKGLEINVLGRMESTALSELFLQSDFGIARVRPNLLGKSGSAIAMLEHGLPLWIPMADNKEQITVDFDFRIAQCFAVLTELVECESQFTPGSRLFEITDEFEKGIEQFFMSKAISI